MLQLSWKSEKLHKIHKHLLHHRMTGWLTLEGNTVGAIWSNLPAHPSVKHLMSYLTGTDLNSTKTGNLQCFYYCTILICKELSTMGMTQ